MKKALIVLLILLLAILLTVLTQVGGVVLLLSCLVGWLAGLRKRWQYVLLFSLFYLMVTWLVIPPLAATFGRERVVVYSQIRPANRLTNLLNRNYVKPQMNQLLRSVADRINDPEVQLQYLDANFPFYNGFPLLPHLSHDDGEKIDLAFIYQDTEGNVSPKLPSMSGYGFFNGPTNDEQDQISSCLKKGYWQYDFTRYFTLGTIHPQLKLSEAKSKLLLEALLSSRLTGKIFIEPHLKARLGLSDGRVRYHGCQAVRHDDHIHLQL